MAIQDVGVRFSEETYATKDEVKAAYNMTMIDHLWEKVVLYRKNYSHLLCLKNADNNPFTLVLTRAIQSQLGIAERRLSKVLCRYNSLGTELRLTVRRSLLAGFLKKIAESYEIEITDEMLTHLISRDLSAFPASYTPLYDYLSAYEYFFEHHFDPFDYRVLVHINKRLAGEKEIDRLNLEPSFRQEEIETPHYFQVNYIYKAAPIGELPHLVEDLCEFAVDDSLSPIARAVLATFYIDYIKPFDFYNESTASLFAKLILARADYEEAGFFLSLEALSFAASEPLKAVKAECQKTLDLTYYLDSFLAFLNSDIDEVLALIEQAESRLIAAEQLSGVQLEAVPETSSRPSAAVMPPSSAADSEVKNSVVNENLIAEFQGKREVALPVFPAGVDDQAVAAIVENLLEVYPYLKKTQAHFYATHCTIGKHYTIAQFRKQEGVAYETARTSMDFLADQGFYAKSQVRNKFVYTPVPRR